MFWAGVLCGAVGLYILMKLKVKIEISLNKGGP